MEDLGFDRMIILSWNYRNGIGPTRVWAGVISADSKEF
jgi:hypothetical protein